MTKPGGIAIVIGEHKPQGAAPADEGTDVGAEGREAAVRDLFDAYKADDIKGGVAALSAFMRYGPPEGSDEEEASESPDDEAAEDNGPKGEKPKSGMYR